MLFVAEYELGWEHLDAAIAKRLEWDGAKPKGFRFVGEFVWSDREPPFRGVAIFEADRVETVNSFVLHYGPTLKIRVHPASDVVSAMAMVGSDPASRGRRRTRTQQVRRVA